MTLDGCRVELIVRIKFKEEPKVIATHTQISREMESLRQHRFQAAQAWYGGVMSHWSASSATGDVGKLTMALQDA